MSRSKLGQERRLGKTLLLCLKVDLPRRLKQQFVRHESLAPWKLVLVNRAMSPLVPQEQHCERNGLHCNAVVLTHVVT